MVMDNLERFTEITAYEKWTKSEGVPVIGGYCVEDLNEVSLKPWQRKGGQGAFINLEGNDQLNDTYLCEISPGGELRPQKHLYEEVILILSGRGATTIWNKEGFKQTFEWQEWSLFAIPLNVWHQHFNGQGDRSARYIACTSAPMTINLFHSSDFIFNNDYVFKDRYGGEQDYYSVGTLYHSNVSRGRNIWESNFISDVRKFKLYPREKRGGGASSIRIEMANNTISQHIAEFPSCTYKKAHRHGPAANIIILNGTGYSLMWPEGQSRIRVDWHQGSTLVPPDNWFHQHFNTGSEPARYIAIGIGTPSVKHPYGKVPPMNKDFKIGGGQIEYEDEDPEIRRLYEEELRKRSLKIKLPPVERGVNK